MGKRTKMDIKESEQELNKLLQKQRKAKNIDRVKSLLLIKLNKFETRQELAKYLGYYIHTMERWLSKYKSGGMEGMLIPEIFDSKSHIVTPEIHKPLYNRVQDENKGFQSYVEAQQWVKQEFDVDITYHWIRAYIIQKFKTKIKQPRKSHIKKDMEAAEAFLKTT